MRRPKLLKLPKAPKSSTPAAMERYVKRLEAVQNENKKRLKPYEENKRKIAALKERARKLREKGAV